MTNTPCPECGKPTAAEATACPNCGHALMNGTVQRPPKPPLPPELEGYVFQKVPPELIEEARRTFNEDEVIEALREVEQTGGMELKDFIHELEEGVPPL